MYLRESDPTHTCTIALAGVNVAEAVVSEVVVEPRDGERFRDPIPEYSEPIDATQVASDRMIGHYRLKRPIGRGMTGSVWLGQDTDREDREVALKIMHADVHDDYVMARYTSEVLAMARMDDPHIARIWENGQTPDGKLFIAMEYVNGLQLSRYCEMWSPTIRERISLAISICRGLEHAHQRGILHRDLKPANILITGQGHERVPKLIDFGLAKSFQKPLRPGSADTTQMGCLLGTIGYMSPEQANTSIRDVDTRSDVYSVCAILYEMLSGTLPIPREELHQVSLVRALQMIQDREAEPVSRRAFRHEQAVTHAARCQTTPTKLRAMLTGDLDAILEKGLSKERERRYQSAGELADDLQQYLTGGMVRARRRTAWYVTQKLMRRHWKTALTISVITIGFLASWVGMGIGFYHAVVERDRARQAEKSLTVSEANERSHKEDAETSSKFLEEVLVLPTPTKSGSDLKLIDALDIATRKLNKELANKPRVEVMVRLTLARSYLRLGKAERAEALLEPIIRETKADYQGLGEHRRQAVSLQIQSMVDRKQLKEAETLCRQVIDQWKEIPDAVHVVRSLYLSLSKILDMNGQFNEANEVLQEGLQLPGDQTARTETDRWQLRSSQIALHIHWARSDPRVMNQALTLVRYYLRQAEGWPEVHLSLQLRCLLAELLCMNNEKQQAKEVLDETVDQCLKHYGPNHMNTMLVKLNVARVMIEGDQLKEAYILLSDVLKNQLGRVGPDHPVTHRVLRDLATISEKQGFPWQTMGHLLQLHQAQVRLVGAGDKDSRETQLWLEKTLRQSGLEMLAGMTTVW